MKPTCRKLLLQEQEVELIERQKAAMERLTDRQGVTFFKAIKNLTDRKKNRKDRPVAFGL